MVDPFVLAECFISLKELELNNTYVTSEQVQALFHAMGRQTNLVKLTLVEILVADVDAELFAHCAHKLEYLKLNQPEHFLIDSAADGSTIPPGTAAVTA